MLDDLLYILGSFQSARFSEVRDLEAPEVPDQVPKGHACGERVGVWRGMRIAQSMAMGECMHRVKARWVVAVMIILATIAVMLMTFPAVRRLGISLLASAGVVGIILGLAAQKTLGNLLSGIQIALAQPIRIDDVVVVENEWGRIEEITLTYVVVRIWDLRRLIVPISYFVEQPFQNWTRVSADLLKTVYVYADYRLPVSEVRDELKRLLDASEYWDKKIWNLQVTNSTDRTMELRALMSVADSSAGWNLQCEIREKLIDFLQQRFPEYLPRVRLQMDTPPDQTGEDKSAVQDS